MPKYSMAAPDGNTYEIEGPEGATEAQVRAEILRQNPNAGRRALANRRKDDSFARGVGLGITQPIDTLARGVSNIPVIGRALDRASTVLGMPAAQDAAMQNREARANNTSEGGQIAGNIIGTLPTMLLPGGPLVQGAAGGAALSEADTAGGVLTDAAMGAAGAGVAQGLLNRAGRAISTQKRLSPFVQQLIGEGVELTPGQIAGGFGRTLEDAATSLPIVGPAIRAAKDRSVETFNRATVNRALAPLGQKLPDAIQTGNDAVRFAGDVLSDGYNKVLANLGGQIDNTFNTRVGAIQQRANLPAEQQKQFDDIIQREVLARIGQGQFTGRVMNQVRDRLDKVGSTLRRSADNAYARDLGESVGQVREQVLALARRQNPTFADALRKLDKGWAELVRIEKAATGAATDGVFTSGQFTAAVRGADRSVRRRAVARGEALGQEWANAARNVLPATIGNPGTADRVLAAGAGLAAGTNPATIVPGLLAAGAGAAAYSPAGTRAIQQFVTRTPGPASQFTARLLNNVPISVAAPALIRRREQ